MRDSRENQKEFDFLLANARAGNALGLTHFVHLDQPIGIRNYLRIADDIADHVAPGSMLDWGCGLGQMTYLLKRRGFDMTSLDIGAPAKKLPDTPLSREVQVIRTTEPTKLPFPDRKFDVVLSCGVLEHVEEPPACGNEVASLHEIGRILRPGGRLLLYQLPQQYSWVEAITRRLKIGYSHPRRYTVPEITRILKDAGYSVERVSRSGMVPKNLTGLPQVARTLYSRFAGALLAFDAVVCRIPVLNALAGVMEITARYDGKPR